VDVYYIFHIVGDYKVILNVTDKEGNWAINQIYVIVLDITPPIAHAGENITTQIGKAVIFYGTQSRDNVCIENYSWSFTYAQSEHKIYGIQQSFIFDIPGIYNIKLIVRDRKGNIGLDNMTVIVLSNKSFYNIDSDNDTFNDSFENLSDSDPYNPLSTPFDIDGDGWNNTIELEMGTDPRNNHSVPPDMDKDGMPDSIDPDRDGDNVLNEKDAYPDDRWKWEEGVEEGSGFALWWVVGIVGVMVVVGIVVVLVMVKRKKKECKDVVEGEGEEVFGRVGKEEDNENC